MTDAMRAHLRLMESDLPRITHYRKERVKKHGGNRRHIPRRSLKRIVRKAAG